MQIYIQLTASNHDVNGLTIEQFMERFHEYGEIDLNDVANFSELESMVDSIVEDATKKGFKDVRWETEPIYWANKVFSPNSNQWDDILQAKQENMLEEFEAYHDYENYFADYQRFKAAYIGPFDSLGDYAAANHSGGIDSSFHPYIDWEGWAKNNLPDHVFHPYGFVYVSL